MSEKTRKTLYEIIRYSHIAYLQLFIIYHWYVLKLQANHLSIEALTLSIIAEIEQDEIHI